MVCAGLQFGLSMSTIHKCYAKKTLPSCLWNKLNLSCINGDYIALHINFTLALGDHKRVIRVAKTYTTIAIRSPARISMIAWLKHNSINSQSMRIKQGNYNRNTINRCGRDKQGRGMIGVFSSTVCKGLHWEHRDALASSNEITHTLIQHATQRHGGVDW